MKAKELIEELIYGAYKREPTCDTIKAGDPEKELKRVMVTMFATVDVVRQAKEWGADMLIVHEPTYYDHWDIVEENKVTVAKKKLIDESGIVVFRYHDHMHSRDIDQITQGELHYLRLDGTVSKTPYDASYMFTANEPITALELANRMENKLGIKHVRIAGERNKKSTKIAACFGTPAGVYELLTSDDVEIVLTGEACEWKLCEYARDASLLGINKSIIVMGHIPSERDGMRLLAERMKKEYKSFETRYIECGEAYTYTDEE
ncbi:MAG: Nif3-like dinuclear metal center hexameric protein [Clostridia bacterium]|nr:Nif3-like dinuclear metal center hexameric protein [Clostridia bacterium]